MSLNVIFVIFDIISQDMALPEMEDSEEKYLGFSMYDDEGGRG